MCLIQDTVHQPTIPWNKSDLRWKVALRKGRCLVSRYKRERLKRGWRQARMRGDDANQTGFHVFVNQRDARSLYRSTARGCYYRPVLILVKVRGFIRSGRNNLGLFTGGDESKGEIWKEQRLVRIVKEGKR